LNSKELNLNIWSSKKRLPNKKKKSRSKKLKRLRSKKEKLVVKLNSLEDKRKSIKKSWEKPPLLLIIKSLTIIKSRKPPKKSKRLLQRLRRNLKINKEKHTKSLLSNKMKWRMKEKRLWKRRNKSWRSRSREFST